MRLIDGDALADQVARKKCEAKTTRYNEGFKDALMRVRSMIHSAETIKARPVTNGFWIEIVRF